MHFKFDTDYVRCSNYRVAMIVANAVLQDSRVLKTAQSVSKLGFQLTLYGWNNKDKVKRIQHYPFEIVLLPNPSFEMMRLGKWKGNKKNIDFKYITDIFAKQLQEIFNYNPPVFMHTHDMIGLAVGGILHERIQKHHYHWIHDIHEYVQGLSYINEKANAYFIDIEKKYIHSPDKLTSVSPALNDILQNIYALKTKPSLVLNTPRCSDFDPYYIDDVRKASGIAENVPLLVYCGNVKPNRGVRTLIEALPMLPEVHLALVTNSAGSHIEELERIAQAANTIDRIHFHKYVPFNQVTSFLRTATIGIHPMENSPNADIALPNKLFEYIHAGLPIVSSSVKTMQQFVKQHNCGSFFDVGDARSLAENVMHILERLRVEPSWKQSIRSLASKYSWEAQEVVIGKIYSELLEHESRGLPKTNAQKKYRILQLPTAAAGQPGELANAFKERGFAASSLLVGKHLFDYPADYKVERLSGKMDFYKQTLTKLIKKYDVFHFHARPLFFQKHYPLPTGMDLVLLRASGKKVFFHFRGSEARLASVFEQCSPYNYVKENPSDIFSKYLEVEQKAFINFVCGVCNKVFVVDHEIQTYVPGSLIVPRVLNLKKWEYIGVNLSDTLKVVHAPSNPISKGTTVVLSTIEKLKAEGISIDFRLVENTTHEKAAETYRWADVVIDQLRVGWYGVLAVEAMALGKAVVTFIRDDLKHYLPYPLPLAIANPDNLYQVLKELISNKEELHSLGLRGRKYVEEIHDSGHVAEILLQLYEAKGNPLDVTKAFDLIDFQRSQPVPQADTKEPDKPKFKFGLFITSVFKYMNIRNFAYYWRVLRRDGIRLTLQKAWRMFFEE